MQTKLFQTLLIAAVLSPELGIAVNLSQSITLAQIIPPQPCGANGVYCWANGVCCSKKCNLQTQQCEGSSEIKGKSN
jgi:hypothetical protein